MRQIVNGQDIYNQETDLESIKTVVGTGTLDTEAQTLIGGVNELNTAISGLIDIIYPVGCYFETTEANFNPNTTWGGTWVLEDEGLVHVSSGTNYAVSGNAQDGGSASISYTPEGSNAPVTLTAAQSGMPSHSHAASQSGYSFLTSAAGTVGRTNHSTGGSTYESVYAKGAVARLNTDSRSANASQSHNHTFTGTAATLDVRQPYKVVNRWHRTA